MFRPCLLIRCQNWYLEIVRHQRCCLIWRTFSANKSKCKSVDLNIGLKSEEKLRAHKESSKGLDPLLNLKRMMHCFVIFFVSDPCIRGFLHIFYSCQKIKEIVFLDITKNNNVSKYFPFFLQNVSRKFVWKGMQFCTLTMCNVTIVLLCFTILLVLLLPKTMWQ